MSLNGTAPMAVIAVQNVFDPSQVFLIDCQQKDHTLNGATFCDELLVLPPGVYEVIVQVQDPNCHTEFNHYKVIVKEGETVEVPINIVCGGNGGLDVIVTQNEQPVVTGITFPGANKFICAACAGQTATVPVEIQVTDSDTACADLVPTWTAVDSNGNVVTSTLLSNFQLVSDSTCVFSALINANAPIGDYNITFTVNDGTTPPTSITFPIHIIDCGCLLHTNTGTATATFDGGTFQTSDQANFTANTPIAQPDGGSGGPMIGSPLSPTPLTVVDGIDLGNLTDYLFFFADGRNGANWQGASKGYVGDVAVDGLQAIETSSGFVPYAGTIYTNALSLGGWQQIIDDNPGQAAAVFGQVALISGLQTELISAFQQINALPATPGFTSVSSTSLNGLNTQNGIAETYVINVTSGFQVSSKIYITGDAGDVYILRWDTDANFANGYQGEVKFQSGGAIVPLGGLKPTNFINVAGDIASSGGGTNPPPPYPQGPRYDDGQGPLIVGGQDFNGGGFFTGYWLTTGDPTILDPSGLWIGPTGSMSNAIFVGGWYTLTTQFSLTSGSSGVYITPPEQQQAPAIDLEKFVSPDNINWYDADVGTGPSVAPGSTVYFRYVITNTGNATLTNVTLTDNRLPSPILVGGTLAPGGTATFFVTETAPLVQGEVTNVGTVSGQSDGITVTDTDPANYLVTLGGIDVLKEVFDGTTWQDANTVPGVFLSSAINPVQYRITVTNSGQLTLTNVVLNDAQLGIVNMTVGTGTLTPGQFVVITASEPWSPGQHSNVAQARGTDTNGITHLDADPANWYGLLFPGLTLEKYVSVDNGLTWFEADVPPGPFLPNGVVPQFRYEVTNTGGTPLFNVTVTDDVLGFIGSTPVLNPGDSVDFIHVGYP